MTKAKKPVVKKSAAKTAAALKPVLVTTEFRGVFFGYIKNGTKLPAEITLTGARNCISWTAAIGGFLGLASAGPDKDCRLGKPVSELTLYKITSVTPVESIAIEKWERK